MQLLRHGSAESCRMEAANMTIGQPTLAARTTALAGLVVLAALLVPAAPGSAQSLPGSNPSRDTRPVVVHAAPATPAEPGERLADASSTSSGPGPGVTSPASSLASSERIATSAKDNPSSQPNEENRPIGGLRGSGESAGGGDTLSQWLGPSWWALLVVLGLIIAAAWVIRRINPAVARGLAGRGGQAGLFKILARWHLAAKQYVALIQVGRRVLLVGVTGQQISQLCEFTDPDEIEHLLANCPSGRSILAEGFSQLLGRHSAKTADAVDGVDAKRPGGSEGGATAGAALDKLNEAIDRARTRINGRSGSKE
jgi:flagellar biosynthetic protein FliO